VPSTVHVLDGHWDVAVHGDPMLRPPAHRLPPHVVPPRHALPGHSESIVQDAPMFVPAGQVFPQSAFVEHGVPWKLSQTSHMHFDIVCPTARQLGLAVVSVLVAVPVVVSTRSRSAASTLVDGRQSRLVSPKSSVGDTPLASQTAPTSSPVSHVPPRMPSFGVASPTHRGHGPGVVAPPNTRASSCDALVLTPLSRFVVPLSTPLTRFSTQTGNPPDDIGSKDPK